MDRRVKERLVGASILVVLIVLIVPELLPGPVPDPFGARLPVSTPEPVRNVTVDLATSKAPTPEPEPDPAAASSAEAPEARSGETPSVATGPGASGTAGTAAAGAAPPAGANTAADPQTAAPSAPLETTAAPPTSIAAAPAIGERGWAVQLGSFASHANADKLARQLKEQGFSVYVSTGGSGPSLRYRVRIGPMADRGAATQAAAELKSSGHEGSLVPPAP
jgi:DedD protein